MLNHDLEKAACLVAFLLFGIALFVFDPIQPDLEGTAWIIAFLLGPPLGIVLALILDIVELQIARSNRRRC